LCVCASAPNRRFLVNAYRFVGFGRLYTEYIEEEEVEVGFASPGVDEVSLVTDLTAAMCTEHEAGVNGPALAVFHVGITRVVGDELRGPAVIQSCELLKELARAVAPNPRHRGLLVIGISLGLFDDIGIQCGFTDGWIPLATKAWFRVFEKGDDPGVNVVRPEAGFHRGLDDGRTTGRNGLHNGVA
jgi:hypothetical protein